VQKALLQRVLMTVERAFAPVNKRKLDRHARVAFEHLSDPNIFDEVAKAASRVALLMNPTNPNVKVEQPDAEARLADSLAKSSLDRGPKESAIFMQA
jgi:hypothetical protein